MSSQKTCKDCGEYSNLPLSEDGYCEHCEDVLDSLARYSAEKMEYRELGLEAPEYGPDYDDEGGEQ